MARRRSSLTAQRWKELAEPAHYRTGELAKLYNRPVRELRREFHQELGCSPQAWLTELRIKVAKILLLSGESVKNVASALYFKHESYFCEVFKSRTGMTPKQFVLTHKKAKQEHSAELKKCPKSVTSHLDSGPHSSYYSRQ